MEARHKRNINTVFIPRELWVKKKKNSMATYHVVKNLKRKLYYTILFHTSLILDLRHK